MYILKYFTKLCKLWE